MRKLALNNSRIGSFKEILPDLPFDPTSNPPDSDYLAPISQTPATQESINAMRAKTLQEVTKKRAVANQRAVTFQKN